MSTFSVRCPKCKSTRVSLTLDVSTRWGGYQSGQPVFDCQMCGKQLFGDAAKNEVAAQMAVWQAAEDEVAAARAPRFLSGTPVGRISASDIRAKLASA